MPSNTLLVTLALLLALTGFCRRRRKARLPLPPGPKGATVFANTWAVLRDEEYYPDRDRFFPDRFLKNGKIDPKLCDVMPNFGYGRRICPGRHFAMDSLQMSIASILTVFNIEKARDNHGQVIEPDIKYISGATRHIRPFKCAITPRSPGAEKLVNNADLL